MKQAMREVRSMLGVGSRAAWAPTKPDDDQWKREIRFAAKVQHCLLEAGPVTLNGITACGWSLPHFAVGGDYYDFLPLPDGGLRIVVADVMGKGFGAAMLMTMVRATVRAVSSGCSSPGQVLRAVNNLLYQDLQCLESFVVMICLDLLPGGSAVRLSSAGAPPPLLLRAADATVDRTPVRGISLGLLPEREYRDVEMEPGEGDLLVLYTDGIVEARDQTGRDLGWAGLGDLLLAERSLPVPTLLQSIMDGVIARGGAEGVRDDVTLVAVRFPVKGEGGTSYGADAAACGCRA